jgi:hypothetical protein
VRSLFGVASGAISMSDGYGKSSQFAFTISSNQTNADLRTLAVNAGWDQSSKVVATIGSGVYISSNSTGTPALTVSGSFPGGVDLVNNGFIIGMGGNGANATVANLPGLAGGNALTVSVAVSITNNGTIGGGGGGGGRGQSRTGSSATSGGGGGGGGRSSNAANSSGGLGGASSGLSALCRSNGAAGTAGTVSSAGVGGAGGVVGSESGGNCITTHSGGRGGDGGGWGAAGEIGSNGTGGSQSQARTSGGAGGSAVSGNSNITWVATGTRLGAIA